MIYGDNPNKINEREDALGLKAYTYVPSIGSIMQSGNLYVYCVNNPIMYHDQNGRWIHIAIGAFVGAAIGGIYSAVEQSLKYGKVNAEEVFIRATFGSIDGLLVSSGVTFTGGAFVQGMLFSGLEEGMIQTSRIKTGRESHYNSTDIITSMVIGGTLGYLGGGSQSRKHLENLSDKFLKRLDSLDEAYKAAKYYIKSSIKETTDIVKDIVEGKIKSVAADISWNEFECFVLYD